MNARIVRSAGWPGSNDLEAIAEAGAQGPVDDIGDQFPLRLRSFASTARRGERRRR